MDRALEAAVCCALAGHHRMAAGATADQILVSPTRRTRRPPRPSCAPVDPANERIQADSSGRTASATNGRSIAETALSKAEVGVIKRRGRDLNPRRTQEPETVFETAAFDRSATPPREAQGSDRCRRASYETVTFRSMPASLWPGTEQ